MFRGLIPNDLTGRAPVSLHLLLFYGVIFFIAELSDRREKLLHVDEIVSRHMAQTNYKPLDPDCREFRLILVQPSYEGSSELICSIQDNVKLDSKPEYVALSYCWGQPVFDSYVVLEGQKVAVTSNLANALRVVRSEGYEMISVDQLCIDQSNKEEKSHQVPLMWDIYSNAQTVLVWLGRASPDRPGGVNNFV